ncbi:MAG: hypothetical protein ACI8QI_002068 [Limisphaerales bacterium]|jgi:hypothetical protein
MKWILPALLFAAWPCVAEPTEPKPLVRAHAHNDYYHKRPLLDALASGFCSVEADVFLKDDTLLVGHSRFELKKERTLESLYLAPLAKRVKANGGSVYKTKAPFHLMIDFKTGGPATYAALRPLLEKYRSMLTAFTADTTKPGAVTIVISGSRPREAMEKDTARLAGYDGRLGDLGKAESRHFMPWISDSWRSHFKWRGKGELPPREQAKLAKIVKSAHADGQKIRFWAAPDTPAAWEIFHKVGVDFINTDHLENLAEFLRAKNVK